MSAAHSCLPHIGSMPRCHKRSRSRRCAPGPRPPSACLPRPSGWRLERLRMRQMPLWLPLSTFLICSSLVAPCQSGAPRFSSN